MSVEELYDHLGDAARDIVRASATSRRRVATIEATSSAPRLNHDPIDNERSIQFTIDERARTLRASGGACTPSQALYDVPVLSTDVRPVRDALPTFVASRGGVRFTPVPTLSDVVGGVGIWTHANDITPSSPSVKPHVAMSCGNVVEVFVDAVTQELQVDNFRNMYFRESVDVWLRQLNAVHARTAETKLINAMVNGSIAAVTNAVIGASRDVLATVDRAASSYRSRQRLAADEILMFIAPSWLRDLCRVDLTREAYTEPSELAITNAQIDAMFAARPGGGLVDRLGTRGPCKAMDSSTAGHRHARR